ncbi:hypothetical protein [Candidatus Desulforudis audaxviator]|uniref:Uncharacterized protein n=1 Tax=Desulforudis audaxviator (strain MP104C) TaxID=477974 RepID=B1I410_DESAP|nr:hypothetical protein [Candidatus Desulforudis audaxviator]ACA59774.1 hypothetical protein Daud_1263 [Candidatus Desulforudis audaxviator MP104C]AZK59774.1 hypothetical protein Daudx_1225 [Candidatus Desulforudis audaxviator]
MLNPVDPVTEIRTHLRAARDRSYSEGEVHLTGGAVRFTVDTTPLRVLVSSGPLGGIDALGVELLDAVRRILGNPPDAVFTRGKSGEENLSYCGVWGNPALTFQDDLFDLVPEIYAVDHRVVLISPRLRSYLVPSHPEDWPPGQVELWSSFWTLRLESPETRERIDFFSHPDTWTYFELLSGKLASLTAGNLTEGTSTGERKVALLYRAAALTGYYLYHLEHREPFDLRSVDFSRVIEQIPENLRWENIPEPVLQIINEVNMSDIRTSGELFRRAALMPPGTLDGLLFNANKCAALGHTTAAVAHKLAASLSEGPPC